MRDGAYVLRDDDTGEVVAVGRKHTRDGVAHLERWNGERWVDWPALLAATGIGGAESWEPATADEVMEHLS